jgi:hypothetical protein
VGPLRREETIVSDDWATRFTQEALAKVDAFIAEHPEYSRHDVPQPGQGVTNHVVFARRGDGLVVLKVFCEEERKERECFGLRHWRDTGLVPELIREADPTLIVMSHVPGVYLAQALGTEGEEAWREACRDVGRATATLTLVPISAADRAAFESRFYGDAPTLEAYLKRILSLGRSINERDPDFRDEFWRSSLDFVQAELSGILSEPAVLYHQDVGNLHVQRGRFMGFFDLEMCRIGSAAMQLGSSLAMLEGDESQWGPFREGWEEATEALLGVADRRAAAAVRHLLGWREISRYMSYDGTPGTGWASPADPARYRASFEAAERMMGVARG